MRCFRFIKQLKITQTATTATSASAVIASQQQQHSSKGKGSFSLLSKSSSTSSSNVPAKPSSSASSAINSSIYFPADCVKPLKSINNDIISYYFSHSLTNSFINISLLYKREDWNIQCITRNINNEDGMASAAATSDSLNDNITSLPFYLRDELLSCVEALTSALPTPPGANTRLMMNTILPPMFQCFLAAIDAIHTAAFAFTSASSTSSSSVSLFIPSSSNKCMTNTSNCDSVCWYIDDNRVMMCLSNVMYVNDVVFPVIFNKLIDLFPVSTHDIIQNKYDRHVIKAVDTLEHILFNRYVRNKAIHLRAAVNKAYVTNGINWLNITATPGSSSSSSSTSKVSDWISSFFVHHHTVRSCILDILLQCVFIHSEVYTIRNDEVDRIMERIVEALAQTLADVLTAQIEFLSPIAALMIATEIAFIKKTLNYYLDDQSDQTFDKITILMYNNMKNNYYEATATSASSSYSASSLPNESGLSEQIATHLIGISKTSSLMFTCFKQR